MATADASFGSILSINLRRTPPLGALFDRTMLSLSMMLE